MADINIENGQNSPSFRSSSGRNDQRSGSRRREHRNSYTPKTLPQTLGLAAFFDTHQIDDQVHEKVSPLYTNRNGFAGQKEPNPTIRIITLQRMTVIHLKRVIAGQVSEIVSTKTASPELMERVRKTMKQYVQALRDLTYMLDNPSQNTKVSEEMRQMRYINALSDPAILADAGLLQTSGPHALKIADYSGHGGPTHRNETASQQTKEFFDRLWMALFGGAVLIAPMLIMRLHPTLVTELVTTSVFVLAFGITLACFMTGGDKKDVLGSTAAYAAVLVVFVGTNS